MSESKDRAADVQPRNRGEGTPGGVNGERVVEGGRPPLADAAEAPAAPDRPEVEAEAPELVQARAEVGRGELATAMATLRGYLTRRPNDARARRQLASVLERRGDLEGAVSELGRALDAAPDDVSLLCARATALTNLKKFGKAEGDLRRAARLDEASADVQLSLGILFCKRARWREAVAPLQRAVELAPDRVLAHYHLAEAYNQTDQLRDALRAYETVVRLDPENWRALKGVGIVLDRLGRPAEATAAYQRAREVQRR